MGRWPTILKLIHAGWLQQVPIYGKWPLPSPYFPCCRAPRCILTAQSPCQDHHSLADHRSRAAEAGVLLVYFENSQNQRQPNTQDPTVQHAGMQ